MGIVRAFTLAFIAMAAVSAGAQAPKPPPAPSFTPLANARFAMNLDSRTGAFSAWEAQDIGTANAFIVRFKVGRLGIDPKWKPNFRFVLVRGQDSVEFAIVGAGEKDPLLMSVATRSGSAAAPPERLLTTLKPGDVAELALRWLPDGSVIINLQSPATLAVGRAGETRLAKLPGPPQSVAITAATGELAIIAAALGRIG